MLLPPKPIEGARTSARELTVPYVCPKCIELIPRAEMCPQHKVYSVHMEQREYEENVKRWDEEFAAIERKTA
jgi:hypothetical protein